MDQKSLKDFMNVIGTVAETGLLFYRSVLEAKATPEEAMRLTQAFLAAIFCGSRSDNPNKEE